MYCWTPCWDTQKENRGGGMSDLNCLLAGLAKLCIPPLLLWLWHKKAGARLYPAPVALLVCLPVFIVAGGIRPGLPTEDIALYYAWEGLLYGIFEEGGKYLALRYLLSDYDSRKDAVSYGIGHAMFEDISGGIACFGLIGAENAAPDIFFVNLWASVSGVLWAAALTVLILYGIRTGSSILTLPAAILLHTVSHAVNGIFRFSTALLLVYSLIDTAVVCYIGYRCWQGLRELDGDAE